MKIQINITKEVLKASMWCHKKGKSIECMTGSNCAIGRAVSDLFEGKTWVCYSGIIFYPQGLEFNENGGLADTWTDNMDIPAIAQQFIRDFDEASPTDRTLMEPFSFEIDVPNEVIDMIGIGQVYKVLSESNTLELVKI